MNPALVLNIFLQVSMLLGRGLIETLLTPQADGDFDNLNKEREIGWAEMGTSVPPEGPCRVCGEEVRCCQSRSWLGALPISLKWPDPAT